MHESQVGVSILVENYESNGYRLKHVLFVDLTYTVRFPPRCLFYTILVDVDLFSWMWMRG